MPRKLSAALILSFSGTTFDKSRQTFHLAIMPISLGMACGTGNLKAARAALTRGEDVNSKDDITSWTPLMNAVMEKKNSTVRLLLEQPALDLNLADNRGYTALHDAAFDNVEGVRLLLADPRLDPNQGDNLGFAPVMDAMICRNVDALRELVAHPSVDLDTRDIWGRSLEEVARIR